MLFSLNTDYAPSFGEMGVAIAAIVEGSSAESSVLCEVATDTMSDLQLTPAQQLVLNCIWLNLKVIVLWVLHTLLRNRFKAVKLVFTRCEKGIVEKQSSTRLMAVGPASKKIVR